MRPMALVDQCQTRPSCIDRGRNVGEPHGRVQGHEQWDASMSQLHLRLT